MRITKKEREKRVRERKKERENERKKNIVIGKDLSFHIVKYTINPLTNSNLELALQ